MKIALTLIVKPGEHELLFRALQNASTEVDGIFVTITGQDKKIEETCSYFRNCHISNYKWDYNFANARNFNFNQVPKEYDYILWMDVDDQFRDIERLRDILEKNQDVDVFTMNYLYWFDEWKNPIVVHLKSQVIKNDKCVTWIGALHEDFKKNRDLTIKFIKGIERLHLSDNKRLVIAKERNLEVSEKDLENYPQDPRSYWNLANSQKAIGLNNEALQSFDTFVKLSKSDDEKYIAMLRMGEIYLSKRNFKAAIDIVKYAIGTKPEYPDAYHLAGNIYYEMGDYVKSRDHYISGLQKKTPRYQIIVYNPREYDYFPLRNLAKVYIELMLPNLAYECLKACLKIIPNDQKTKLLVSVIRKEKLKFDKVVKEVERLQKIKDIDKLKEELDLLPEDIRSHPAVCKIRNINFIKETSSGKDVVFYCGYTAEMWNPDLVKEKGIGGSEEAVINLAKEFKKSGYNVEVYNHCGREIKTYEGVIYKPFWMYNYNDKQDILILWRSPRILSHKINASKIFIDLHDVLEEGEFTEDRLEKIDKIMVKSQTHRKLFPNIPDDKFAIIPNGVDLTLFNKDIKRDPYYLVNFSSPDRSLNSLLDIYKDVLSRLNEDIKKKVTLGWFYGWTLFDQIRVGIEEQEWKDKVQKKFEALPTIGGIRISHEKVAIENLRAGAIIYPSQFYEIDWIGGSKAQIAGCLPITTNYAGIGEKVKKYGVKIDVSNLPEKNGLDFGVTDKNTKEIFVNAILDYLNNVDKYEKERNEMSSWAKEQFNLERIAKCWIDEFKITSIIKPQEYARV